MRPLGVLFSLALLTACASAGKPAQTDESQRATREGIYEFSAVIQGVVVRGKLHVLPDTILVDSEQGDCGAAGWESRYLRVGCRSTAVASGTFLLFDRENPGLAPKWSGYVAVKKRREVCDRYEVRQGREVCAARKIETYEEPERRSGPVQVRRVL